ncbi:hypothetical protein SERLADRAFT_388970 [Serpula lacrymans var. lacrymans S7.9]|nr:uncharacterized protein SERLADRAFT_388970 [Serpula lacrymans var. lacrymans S7.9]EGO24184.1 hypothetical protein SERLADRAFT_388970 [Serpula lacrymans var. lacrymans S7.9]
MLFDSGYLTYTLPTPLPHDDNPLSPNQSLPALSPNIGYRRDAIESYFTPLSPDLGTGSQRGCAVEDHQRHHRYDAFSRCSSPYPTTNHTNARRRYIHTPPRRINSQDFGHSDSSPDISTPPPDMKLVVATDAIKIANEGRRIHPARFTCEICSQNFTTRHSKARHISSHLGERPYKCTLCGQAFTNKTDCKRHEKSKKRHQLPPC